MGASIKVLGAYGVSAQGYGASSFYLDRKNVIDAGNLLEALDDKLIDVENVWLTHSHLDHINDIAYLLDNYFYQRKKTLKIYGLPQTIKALQKHIFNNIIWPDFSKINLHNSDQKALKYQKIEIGEKYNIGKDKYIKAYKTDHTVDSCGYIYTKGKKAILITADTYSLKTTIKEIHKDKRINNIVIECSFSSDKGKLAKETKHLTLKLIQKQLKRLKNKDINIYLNHMKPSSLKKIDREIAENRTVFRYKTLKDKEIIYF